MSACKEPTFVILITAMFFILFGMFTPFFTCLHMPLHREWTQLCLATSWQRSIWLLYKEKHTHKKKDNGYNQTRVTRRAVHTKDDDASIVHRLTSHSVIQYDKVCTLTNYQGFYFVDIALLTILIFHFTCFMTYSKHTAEALGWTVSYGTSQDPD